MKKRLEKKLHKKYLSDIVCDISQSSVWRKRLFESLYDTKYLISIENSAELPQYIKTPILKYNLRYFVSKIEGIVDDWDFYYDGGVLFRFEAVKYGSIHGYSFNNTEVI